jgi:hypothetical protein
LRPAIQGLPGYITETIQCSPQFYADILDGIHSVPDEWHEFLHQQGRTIRIGDQLLNMDPSLRSQLPPPPYGAGSYAEAHGLYNPDNGQILVAELSLYQMHLVPNPHPAATCREEVGHAIDDALGTGQQSVSEVDPAFRQFYQIEESAITDPGEQANLALYLGGGPIKLQELFTQLFAIHHGGGTELPTIQQLLVQRFPRCYQRMQELTSLTP